MESWKGLFFTYCTIFLALGCSQQSANYTSEISGEINFNYHIKPILSDRCFACHGPDKNTREAGLRLDTPEGALEHLLESGNKAFVAHSKSKSEAFQRMVSDDPNTVMPPPESKLTLTQEEVELIGKWIDQGAEYMPHWSFIPPEQPAIPSVTAQSWPQNPIDYFILDKLEEKDWNPSPQADTATLLRRLSFTLTGLPPTQQQLQQLMDSTTPFEIDQYIEELLNSPAYGEHMAATWLDVARYADSDGYLDDKHRDFTPWRDWVIRAFNHNMPYDQFITWQLAGDLIPSSSQDQVLATAFNRLHKKNSEAGIIFEEYRSEYVADRTNTFGKALLGLTLECARCHDHKYDPITQKEYFQFFSFFNSTNEIGTAVYGPDQTPGPALMLTSDEVAAKHQYIRSEIQKQEQQLKTLNNTLRQSVEEEKLWSPQVFKRHIREAQQAYYSFDHLATTDGHTYRATNHLATQHPIVVTNPDHREGASGKALFVKEYHSIKTTGEVGKFERTDPFSISLWLYPDTVYDNAGIFYHCENLRLGYKGYTMNLNDNKLEFIISHSWPQNAIQVTSLNSLPVKKWSHVTVTYDGSSKAEGIRLYVNGSQVDMNIDYDHLYKGIIYEPDIHTYGFAGFYLGYRDKIPVYRNGGLDELIIFNREISPLEVKYIHQPSVLSEIDINKDEYEELISEHLTSVMLREKHQKALSDLKQAREKENNLVNDIPEIMVMGDLEDPRPTFLLERGDYRAPGDQVYPTTPEVIKAYSEDYAPNRLGLVSWLFEPDHPLTARVIVNRIWQMHFGRGLVNTSDDFGSQGDLPSHPELLDWLSRYFIDSGWDIKALHQLIVSSATYQQESVIKPEIHEQDPENILLSRGPRFRLPAETIRDNTLAISGLLVNKIGGSSQYPYQPEGLWDEITNKVWRYPYLQSEGEGLYRRSLYTIWKRTAPPPSMLIFDIADRDVCTVKRRVTQTPLQALVLLNDVQYIEASRTLAERLLADETLDDPLNMGFMTILGRLPGKREKQLLQQQFEAESQYFSNHPKQLEEYLNIGVQHPEPSLNQTELAAMSVVMHSLLNTDEAILIK